MYKSSTLAKINECCLALNRSGIFPYGHSTEIATIRGHDPAIIRQALKGRPTALDAIRSIVEEAERLAKIKPVNITSRKVSHLTIAELYEQNLLPFRYSQLAAAIAGCAESTVRSFIEKQRKGHSSYASSENVKEALYQIASENEEWELLQRLEKILQKVKG